MGAATPRRHQVSTASAEGTLSQVGAWRAAPDPPTIYRPRKSGFSPARNARWPRIQSSDLHR